MVHQKSITERQQILSYCNNEFFNNLFLALTIKYKNHPILRDFERKKSLKSFLLKTRKEVDFLY